MKKILKDNCVLNYSMIFKKENKSGLKCSSYVNYVLKIKICNANK